MSDWFQRARLDWIIETIQIYGYINREHIERKFRVSTPQASADLGNAITACPAIAYNKASKHYEYNAAPIMPELPERCKMRSTNRYASDEDCAACGLGEGDACAAFEKRVAIRALSPSATNVDSDGER